MGQDYSSISELEMLLAYIEGRGVQEYGDLKLMYEVLERIPDTKCSNIKQLLSTFTESNFNRIKGIVNILRRLKIIFFYNNYLRKNININSYEELITTISLRIIEWFPTRLLLRFIADKGGEISSEEVINNLGKLMKTITSKYSPIMSEILGLSRINKNGVMKPFNRHVVEAVLFKLLKNIGILQGTQRRVRLTDIGWMIASQTHSNFDHLVVTTEPEYPQIGVVITAIAGTKIQSNNLIFATYSIDLRVVDHILQLAKKALNNKITFIMGPPAKQYSKRILYKCRRYDIRCKLLCTQELHAKVYINNKYILLTSANLTRAGLARNYEVGVLLSSIPQNFALFTSILYATAGECS